MFRGWRPSPRAFPVSQSQEPSPAAHRPRRQRQATMNAIVRKPSPTSGAMTWLRKRTFPRAASSDRTGLPSTHNPKLSRALVSGGLVACRRYIQKPKARLEAPAQLRRSATHLSSTGVAPRRCSATPRRCSCPACAPSTRQPPAHLAKLGRRRRLVEQCHAKHGQPANGPTTMRNTRRNRTIA